MEKKGCSRRRSKRHPPDHEHPTEGWGRSKGEDYRREDNVLTHLMTPSTFWFLLGGLEASKCRK